MYYIVWNYLSEGWSFSDPYKTAEEALDAAIHEGRSAEFKIVKEIKFKAVD